MTQFVFANNVNTTLASSISSSATTLTLASSTNLPASIPAGDYFALTLNDAATRNNYEIVYATAVSGATLTVIRAQEGTPAQAWATGDFAYSGPTAGQMESFNTGEGVSSFNTRTGAVTLEGSDVTTALGYTPVAPPVVTSFNTRTGNVVMDSADVDEALGYTPANDASVVHIAGTETITGAKTFSTSWQTSTNGSTWGYVLCTPALTSGSLTGLIGFYKASGTRLGYLGYSTGTSGNDVTVTPETGSFGILGNGYATGTFNCGALTCTTSNAIGSDRRLKHDIRKATPLPLHRLVRYVSFVRNVDGSKGRGVIAQSLRKHRPEYVGTFEVGGKQRLSVDMTSLAYEQAVWASQEVDRLTKRTAKLERALDRARIEPRKRGFVRRLLEAVW